ncbi:MAG: hypothetical protein Q9221_008265 [Calogaya cf. arnoldii]
MLTFKRILIWALALALSAHLGVAIPASKVLEETPALDKRQGHRARLQYSPQGRYAFTVALKLSEAIYDAFTSSNAEVSKQLAFDFKDWVQANNADVYRILTEEGAKLGGLWSKQAGGYWTFGIGFQSCLGPYCNDINFDFNDIKTAFVQWASKDGSVFVEVIQRPNDFIPLESIGANHKIRRDRDGYPARVKGRSQVAPKCPSENKKLLESVTDEHIEELELRFVYIC